LDITDGALGEIQGIVRNLQKHGIHAMNRGVTTADQVAADQAEVDVALQSIDRIIQSTNYAGRKLLDNLVGGTSGMSGHVVMNGKNLDAELLDTASTAKMFDRKNGTGNLELLDSSGKFEPKINMDPQVDENGLLLQDKTFTITGRDGDPETTETLSFAAGTHIDDMVAKLRQYTITPSVADTLDPDYVPPSVRKGESINNVGLDVNALAHLQGMNDQDAADFLTGYMTNFTQTLAFDRIDISQLDPEKLNQGEKMLLALSENLINMGMGGLGTTQVSLGVDENGNERFKTVSLRDMYSGGAASLAVDPDAFLAVLKSTNSEILSMRADIAATRKYAIEANENLLLSELESTTRCESYIRDTDMASTIVDFTRSKLVSQVGMQMLSAANQGQRSILNLLA
jgi:Flagellin and related hook-associated proteins